MHLCIAGLIFLNPAGYSESSVGSLKTKLALTATMASMQPYVLTIFNVYRLCKELVVFDSEREDGMYEVGPWLLSETLALAPVNVLFPVLFTVVIYVMGGLRLDSGGSLARPPVCPRPALPLPCPALPCPALPCCVRC